MIGRTVRVVRSQRSGRGARPSQRSGSGARRSGRSRRSGFLAFVVAAIALAGGLGGAPAPVVASPLPLAGIVIAIDPGHNGGNASHPAYINRLVWSGIAWKACNTVGTSTFSGYAEHAFNFDVARRLKARLEALGATVSMTRTSDTGVGPCVDVRGRFGAKVHADLMVSIHGNGAPTGSRGFFVMKPALVTGFTDDIVGRSATLARRIRDGLASVGLPIANYYATDGIKVRRDLGTLNWSDVPVVMVELGNMHNASDAARMRSTTGRSLYAAGLLAGIRGFLGR